MHRTYKPGPDMKVLPVSTATGNCLVPCIITKVTFLLVLCKSRLMKCLARFSIRVKLECAFVDLVSKGIYAALLCTVQVLCQ